MLTETTNQVNRVNGTATETAPKPTTPKAKPKKSAKKSTPRKSTTRKQRLESFRLVVTIALGIAIPALSLALSHIAGTLARHTHTALAIFAGGCGVSVLAVSLSHLAEAVEDITVAKPWQAWLLAVTLDLTLIACELVHVFANDAGLTLWCYGLMAVVAVFSMALNVYAFLACRK